MINKVNNLISRNFFQCHSAVRYHSVEIMEFYCHHFSAKIPWNQLFTKELYSRVIWRKIIYVVVNFSFFHTVGLQSVVKWRIYFHQKNISSHQLLKIISLLKTLVSRNFCQKCERVNFCNCSPSSRLWSTRKIFLHILK